MDCKLSFGNISIPNKSAAKLSMKEAESENFSVLMWPHLTASVNCTVPEIFIFPSFEGHWGLEPKSPLEGMQY